jgi:hypothetical protein
VTDVLIIDHSTSGTPAASYGTGLRFRGQDSTTPSQEMGRVRTVWTDPTHLSRASKMVLSTYAVGSEVTGIEILGSDVSIDNGIVYARNLVARSTGSSAAPNTGWFNFKAFDSSPVATFYSSTDTLLASVPAAGGVRYIGTVASYFPYYQ